MGTTDPRGVELTLEAPGLLDIPSGPVTLEASAGGPVASTDAPSAFERLVRGLAAAVDQGDALVEGAATGRYAQMDAATLIALQAGIYRYGEAIDLCAKLVDRAAAATRTVLEAGR